MKICLLGFYIFVLNYFDLNSSPFTLQLNFKFWFSCMRQQMNKEAKKLTGVKVKYSLYDKSNNEINGFGYNYTILWHDTKMKNYLDLIKNLPTKHIATSRIVPILVVDKVEQMVNIYNIEKEIVSKPIKQRRLDRFGLFTDNTDTEKKKEFIAQINKGFNIMVLRSKFHPFNH